MLRLLSLICVGVLGGLGSFTFIYAKGFSYLTNDPQACANCHVMNDEFLSWQKSSHKFAASCNDCHTPHNFFGKYFTKGLNGFNHSWAFTLGGFHEPIQIGKRNAAVAEQTCRHCHAAITHAIDDARGELTCVRCHRSVGHLK